ncbi:hypothetical protein BU23DRAFT_177692 [Bimuria novae-zelandiae CBS 107.79]|uniref:RanBD1 domain-containing protein n=1 Tax=Bimuria novae-zelandiae CBS 107.79 TaxID=1447943 RepID=A0A6A5V2E9_9PLEO|nr:hypothetical protein BU23DRAFT_177692 [Bimuria novae-zelandiae CBS 107.79]
MNLSRSLSSREFQERFRRYTETYDGHRPEDNTANETAVPNAADEPTHNDQTVQNPFTPQSSFTPAPAPEQQPTTATPSNDPFKASKPATFGSTSTSIAATFTPAPTLKPAPSESATTSTAPTFTPAPASKPAASSSKETSKDTPVSTIPRVHVPPEWTANMTSTNDLRECTRALVALNEFYRGRLAQLSPTADWSALSKWHLAQSSELKKKIDQLRKQEAAAKGITGEETILSTKRKNDEQGPVESPFKKARSGEAPATPQSKASALPSTTPKTNPPLTSFNIFASASSQQSTPGTNNFSKSATQQSAPATEPANAGGFKPILGPSSACGNPSGGFKPSFGASSATDKPSGGGFFSQFGGKTKEQLRKERLQQALDKDYDSPTESEEEEGNYETKEQFIARWNKAEDERQAALDVAANSSTLKFVPTATNKKTDIPTLKFTNASSNEPSASQSLASGTSTPGFFGSRVGSPAPSTEGARSVFDTPAGTQTPNNNNPFGHLSASSSQRQDDSDDDADDEAAPRSSNGVGSHKRKMSDAEGSESSETLEETMRRKKHATEKPSLFSRMSYGNSNDDQDASETPKQLSLTDRITRENSEAAPESVDENTAPPMLNATNSKLFNIGGSQTPAPKKAFQFDFAAAAAKSAPPKQSTLAGDQTFKVGDPIKFGSSTSTPSQFNFTPATPTAPASAASTTPAKPATNPFAFLGAAAHSAANSAVSSRAATPATDAEASGTDSAAINEEEGKNFVDNEDKSLLSDAERDEFNVLFEFPQTIARKIVKKEGGAPAWEKVATGRLWILQNKKDESIIIRLRIKSGAIKVNHRLVSGVPASLTGSSNQQVRTTAPVVKDGSTGFEPLVFAFNGSDVNEKQELAKRFMTVYNQHV